LVHVAQKPAVILLDFNYKSTLNMKGDILFNAETTEYEKLIELNGNGLPPNTRF